MAVSIHCLVGGTIASGLMASIGSTSSFSWQLSVKVSFDARKFEVRDETPDELELSVSPEFSFDRFV